MLSVMQGEPAGRLTSSSRNREWKPSLHYNPQNYEDYMQVIRQLRSNNGRFGELDNNSATDSKADPEPAAKAVPDTAGEDVPNVSSAVDSALNPAGAHLSPDGNFTESHCLHKLICI